MGMFQPNPRLKIHHIKQITKQQTIQRWGMLSVTITTSFFFFAFIFFKLLCYSSFCVFRDFVVALFSQCSLYSDREPYGAHFGSKQIYKEPTTLRPVFRI